MPVQWDDAAPTGVQWDQPAAAPPSASSGWGQAYQNVRSGASRLLDFLNDPTGSFEGARKAAGMPPASEQYNPLPPNLTTGLAQTAVGLAPGGAGLRPALLRTGAAAAGGAGGAALEGQDPTMGAVRGGAPVAAMEAVVPPLAKVATSLPFVKGAINERQSQNLLGAMTDVNPAAGPPIQAAPVSPYMRGGTTAAQIKRANEGGTLQDAVSHRFDTSLTDIANRAGNPMINGPALQQGYQMMPQLARDQLVGPVGPQGMTLQQAHAVRSWLGGTAFSQSPQGQGVGPIPQQRLWGQMSNEMQQAITPGGPQVLADWQRTNTEYGGMQKLMEALGGAFQGQPNRVMLNRSALSDYLAKNEQEITRSVGGPQQFQDFVNRVLSGGQAGTRDVLAPGSGGPLSALMQTFGRGQGGAPQLIGAPVRTLLPNVGSEYTGRGPGTLPPYLQNLLDVAAQGQAGRMAQ